MNPHASKACEPERVPRVQIPPSPPFSKKRFKINYLAEVQPEKAAEAFKLMVDYKVSDYGIFDWLDKGEITLFQSTDGRTKIQVRFEGNLVWLTQAAIAELFQTTSQNITIHLKSIYDERELSEEATCKEYLQVRNEGKRRVNRSLKHYSLEAILAVGYRVRSDRGTQFRQWATTQLKELLVKGFVMDDDRLKEGQSIGQDYFDELLLRIRDIRASERRFYQKVTDIYATSIDYDPRAEVTQAFYATIQNKLHWATHGKTAAEVISTRADASRKNMGLTTWKNSPHGPIRKHHQEARFFDLHPPYPPN